MRVRRTTWLGWGLLVALSACGGGGSGGPAGGTVQVQGTAKAPGGRLTKVGPGGRALATLDPVAGASVYVFRVNDDGFPTGPVLAQTTTDASGSFSFDADPSWIASDVVVQVRGTGPSPVGGGNLAAPLVGTEIVVDPATELATRDIVDQSALSNFTTSETQGYVEVVETVFQTDGGLVGANVQETISNIEGALPSGVDEVLESMDAPGELPVPTGVNGVYRFVEYVAGFDVPTLANPVPTDARRYGGTGTLTIDAAAKTAQLVLDRAGFERTAQCGPGPCDRTFVTSAAASSSTATGTFTLAGSGFVLFTFGSGADAEVSLGSATPDGSILVLPVSRSTVEADPNGIDRLSHAEQGMRVGVREDLSLSVSSLNGDYGFGQLSAQLPPSSTVANAWDGYTSVLTDGGAAPGAGLQLNGGIGAFAYGGLDISMRQQVACSGPGCGLSATFAFAQTPSGDAGAYTVGPNGVVTLNGLGGPVSGLGTGQALVLQPFSPAAGSVGLTFATRLDATPSLAVSSLHGLAYNFTSYEEVLTEDAGVHGALRTGTILFAPGPNPLQGTIRMKGTNLGITRNSCLGGECSFEAMVDQSEVFDQSGFYAVTDASGKFMINLTTYGNLTLLGSISSDLSVFVMGHYHDVSGISGSSRLIAIATRR